MRHSPGRLIPGRGIAFMVELGRRAAFVPVQASVLGGGPVFGLPP